MSLNESFIQEVSDEVRRDRLYTLFRKYGWIGVFLILLLVGGAGVNEWRKSKERLAAEQNGDELRAVLQSFSDSEDVENYLTYLNKGLPGKSLAVLNPAFLMSSVVNSSERLVHLETVANNKDLPIVLRDLALLYTFYISELDFDRKMDMLNSLSGPDRPYRLLAIEAKIDLLLSNELFIEALAEVELLEPDLPSSGMRTRIINLKRIIQDNVDPK
ncbi:MAG: hypothetical protein P8L82_00465 [Paracoccaceae bacterium]|nr:hypothetical protein [Paracoccaceae bacterium]